MPKGKGVSVASMMAGVQADIDALKARYLADARLTYISFREAFQVMRFEQIFDGFSVEIEEREFNEKLLIMVANMVVGEEEPPDPTTQHFGLYLLYSLYLVQHDRCKMKIRVTPDHLGRLSAMMRRCYTDGHRGLVSLELVKMLYADTAFDVVMFQQEHNPLTHHRRDDDDDDANLTCASSAEPADFAEKNAGLMRALTLVGAHYNKSMSRVQAGAVTRMTANEPTPVELVKQALSSDAPAELSETAERSISSTAERSTDTIGSRRASLKAKASCDPIRVRGAVAVPEAAAGDSVGDVFGDAVVQAMESAPSTSAAGGGESAAKKKGGKVGELPIFKRTVGVIQAKGKKGRPKKAKRKADTSVDALIAEANRALAK